MILILMFSWLFHVCLIGHSLSSSWIPSRPNIILIMTDDQDIELGSMKFMPKTVHLLQERGVTFKSGFVSTPICCPSRSSILTGMYAHNHHVLTNNQNCSGTLWRNSFEKRTFAVYLREANYTNAYFGKYLNEYNGLYVPPGWVYWMGLIRNSRFYNYSVNVNGDKVKHGSDYHKDYFTDLIANETILFLRKMHTVSENSTPYMIVLSFPAPHGPEDPAPQYSTWFDDVETHRTASWNYAPNPDKQWLLQHTGRMEPVHVVFTDVLHRRRLQTLQSVDYNIHRLINELRDLGDLSNTYIIYTSDHGYHLGQFGLVKGKNMPYEFDIRVPYFIRGPGLPKNLTLSEPVMNVDLAPTILDIAGIPQPKHMDGRSLLPLMHYYGNMYNIQKRNPRKRKRTDEGPKWRHTVLIERGKMAKLTRIRYRIMKQKRKYSKDARVQKACSTAQYKEPCQKGQIWKCVRDTYGKWKIYKCNIKLNVSKVCECNGNIPKRRRYQRSKRRGIFEKVNVHRVATIVETDEEGERVDVDDELSKRWENEFLQYIQEKELSESGQWFQGVFEYNNEIDDIVERRQRRSLRREREKRRNERGRTFGPSVCSRHNMTVLCQPVVYKDAATWTVQKAKVDGRIENLRRKLLLYKDMRRTLKRSRPFGNSASIETKDIDRCICSITKAYSIKEENGFKTTNQRIAPPTKGNLSRNVQKMWHRQESHLNCSVPQMNCFLHGSDHWRTPPLWPELYGEFCFCQNSNNNTYWCLRTVNSTHNFLYCEFITEFISYYDLNSNPDQLHNIIWTIPLGVLEQLSKQLELLRSCQQTAECEHYSSGTWYLPIANYTNS